MLAKFCSCPTIGPTESLSAQLASMLLPPLSSVSWGGVPMLQTNRINPAPSEISVKSIEEEENCADADYCAQDERIPSLPQVDPLDEIINRRETV